MDKKIGVSLRKHKAGKSRGQHDVSQLLDLFNVLQSVEKGFLNVCQQMKELTWNACCWLNPVWSMHKTRPQIGSTRGGAPHQGPSGPSPGFSSKEGQNQKGGQNQREGPKPGGAKTRRRGQNQKGCHILKIQYWMYVANGGPNVKWGGTDFKSGCRAPLAPPLATALGPIRVYGHMNLQVQN